MKNEEIERKEKADTKKITDDDFRELFNALDKGEIAKDSAVSILTDICRGQKNYSKYKLISDKELEKEIKKIE